MNVVSFLLLSLSVDSSSFFSLVDFVLDRVNLDCGLVDCIRLFFAKLHQLSGRKYAYASLFSWLIVEAPFLLRWGTDVSSVLFVYFLLLLVHKNVQSAEAKTREHETA